MPCGNKPTSAGNDHGVICMNESNALAIVAVSTLSYQVYSLIGVSTFIDSSQQPCASVASSDLWDC